jgi:hypothetical protein
MRKAIFQIMAGFALCFAAVLLLGGILTMLRYPPRSPWHVVPLTALVITLIVAGIGLFYLRKWAALAVSLMALYVATWQVEGALNPIPGYANWLGFLFAVLLAIPAILTAMYWRTLVWRSKRTPTQVS